MTSNVIFRIFSLRKIKNHCKFSLFIVTILIIFGLGVKAEFPEEKTEPFINEIMSSNLSSIKDKYEPGLDNCRVNNCTQYYIDLSQQPFATYDGDYPDWIELYNPGDTDINMTGYGLSDDPGDPFKWIIPTYIINPGEHMVFFATGNDRKPPQQRNNWETVINRGDIWKYFVGSSDPPSDWRSLSFDDSVWQSGPSGFGFGDDDDSTVIPQTTAVFMRKIFY